MKRVLIKEILVLGVSVPLPLYQMMEAPTTEVLQMRYTNLRALYLKVKHIYLSVVYHLVLHQMYRVE